MRLQLRFAILEGLGDLLTHYNQSQSNPNPNVQALDRVRIEQWTQKERQGAYVRHLLHAYYIRDPRLKPDPETDSGWPRWWNGGWSLSAKKCLERTAKEHEALVSEFNGLLAGVESSLERPASSRRMSGDELFLS
jgi:hypothetical protein